MSPTSIIHGLKLEWADLIDLAQNDVSRTQHQINQIWSAASMVEAAFQDLAKAYGLNLVQMTTTYDEMYK